MGAPESAYPVGKHGKRDEKGQALDAEGKPIPPQPMTCTGCGWNGDVLDLLGCDEEETLWCPMCGTSAWTYRSMRLAFGRGPS
jgi:hypothetical protein